MNRFRQSAISFEQQHALWISRQSGPRCSLQLVTKLNSRQALAQALPRHASSSAAGGLGSNAANAAAPADLRRGRRVHHAKRPCSAALR